MVTIPELTMYFYQLTQWSPTVTLGNPDRCLLAQSEHRQTDARHSRTKIMDALLQNKNYAKLYIKNYLYYHKPQKRFCVICQNVKLNLKPLVVS